jgi:hypothetical protein
MIRFKVNTFSEEYSCVDTVGAWLEADLERPRLMQRLRIA